MDDLRALSAHNEEEMKMELNEMEKQLHKAICQSVELEKKLTEILAEKTTLLEKVSIDAESKSVEVENLKTQLSVISDLERKHQEIIQSDRKKFDQKFLILRDNDRRSKSRIRQLEEELDEKVENLKKFDEMDEMLSLANEKVEHLNAILKNVEKLSTHLNAYKTYHDKLGNTLGTAVNHYNDSSKEFKKIDKDVIKISSGNSKLNISSEEIEKPLLED